MVKISEAELKVMKVIWKKKEVTSIEIIKELEECNWNHNTIRTLINRLIIKKAVGISKREGKTYTYVPLIKENDYKIKKTKMFVSEFYDGCIRDMLVNFVDEKEITRDDLQYLMNKIDSNKK